MRPNACTASSTIDVAPTGSDTLAKLAFAPPARRNDVGNRLLCGAGLATIAAATDAGIVDDHRCTLAGAQQSDFPSDAPAGAGHRHNLVFQDHVVSPHPPDPYNGVLPNSTFRIVFSAFRKHEELMAGTVRSVSQTFAILRMLSRTPLMSLSEVAKACTISPSTCLGLLQTLVAEGVITQASGKRYALAAGWSDLPATSADAAAQLIARARPLLDRLARVWKAPIGLWRTASRDRLELVALGESNEPTRIHMVVGQRQPFGSGAVGRAFASVQPLDLVQLARRFDALRWQQPISFESYRQQIAEAAERGYAVDDRLSYAGITSVAVGVPGSPSIFCVSATVFADSRSGHELDRLGCALHDLAQDLRDNASTVSLKRTLP